jgi:hypothetical protein
MTPQLTTDAPMPNRSERSWTQRVGRSNVFAWVVSAGLHGLLFLALYVAVLRDEPAVRRVIIPEARLAAAGEPTARQPIDQKPLQLTAPKENTPPPTPRPDERIVSAAVLNDVPSLVMPAERPTDGTAPLTGHVAAGPAAQAPPSSFFGQTGNAYKVVYVVDVSASLMIYIDDIVREMRDSIRGLIPTQKFHVVLARPRQVEELPPRRLVPAIAKYKREADTFLATIDRIPKPGKADPIEAMRRAFAASPDLIYFLSDGDYTDIENELERELQRLNPGKDVCITTIGFHPPRPEGGKPEILQRIAQWHNGHFRLVEMK